MKSIKVKVSRNLISQDSCECAGIKYPASGLLILQDDGEVTRLNGVGVNTAASNAARLAAGFKFAHEVGLPFGSDVPSNMSIFK